MSEANEDYTFRATGITAYLENGGTIEHAKQIACHESPKTTKLYDRTSERVTLNEIDVFSSDYLQMRNKQAISGHFAYYFTSISG